MSATARAAVVRVGRKTERVTKFVSSRQTGPHSRVNCSSFSRTIVVSPSTMRPHEHGGHRQHQRGERTGRFQATPGRVSPGPRGIIENSIDRSGSDAAREDGRFAPEHLGHHVKRTGSIGRARLDIGVLGELVPADQPNRVWFRVERRRELAAKGGSVAPSDHGRLAQEARSKPGAAGAIQRPLSR